MKTQPMTGALKSPFDPHSWTLASVGAGAAAAVSYAQQCFIDLSWVVASMQGQIGCCVGCTAEEMVRMIQHGISGNKGNPATDQELSFRFVYAACKALEGKKITNADGSVSDYTMYGRTAGANDGTYPSLAAAVIRKYGVPLAKYCPNDVDLSADAFCYNRILGNIPTAAFADALTRRSGADLAEPVTAAGLKAAINYAKANKGGVMILRSIGDGYWIAPDGSSSWAKGKLLPMPAPRAVESGHEETLYGYLDITKADRASLQAHTITVESLIAKYPEGSPADATRTDTLIFWLNHWSQAWCSTSGIEDGKNAADLDGGRGWEFLDVWLPYIGEMRVIVPALPPAPVTFRYTFSKNLKAGDKGADVVALQHVLDLEGCYDYAPTDGTAKYTGNYVKDGYTQSGVTKLQQKYASAILTPLGLTKGTGVFADSTRKWVNAKYGIIS